MKRYARSRAFGAYDRLIALFGHVNGREIIAHRLAHQRLIGVPHEDGTAVIRLLGAMQAQEYYGAKWAIGLRSSVSDAAIEASFNAGAILRTHVLRPTWHFVLPEDIQWMLMLTGPRVHRSNAFMCRKLGLDAKILKRSTEIIARALEGGKHLERVELMALLEHVRIDTSEFRSAHIMMHAELEAVVCSGPRKGKQFTYALLDERVPKAKEFTRDEALAELTSRYFTSRGPATVNDYAMWSGLTMVDAKKGIAMVQDRFTKVIINGHDNWYPLSREPGKVPANTVHLLPNYDEYGIGYKDRSAFHDPAQAARSGPRGNPVFQNLMLLNGRLAGAWDRSLGKNSVSITTSPFAPLPGKVADAVLAAQQRYARFLGLALSKEQGRG